MPGVVLAGDWAWDWTCVWTWARSRTAYQQFYLSHFQYFHPSERIRSNLVDSILQETTQGDIESQGSTYWLLGSSEGKAPVSTFRRNERLRIPAERRLDELGRSGYQRLPPWLNGLGVNGVNSMCMLTILAHENLNPLFLHLLMSLFTTSFEEWKSLSWVSLASADSYTIAWNTGSFLG